jgi:hypothetical protein
MAVVSGSFIDRNQGSIQEILGQAAYLMLRAKDPVFSQLVLGNRGASFSGEIGRDLKVRKRYLPVSATGVIQNGGLGSNPFFGLYGDATTAMGHDVNSNTDGPRSKHFLQTLASVAPDPAGSAMQQAVGLTFRLHEAHIACMETLAQADADMLPSAIRNFTEPHLMGLAHNITQYLVNQFYTAGNSMKLGTFPAAMSTGNAASQSNVDTDNRLIRFAPTEGNTYRFYEGMEVDIWPSAFDPASPSGNRVNGPDAGASSSTDVNPAKRVRVIVHSVDHMEGIVTLACASATVDGTTATFATWTGASAVNLESAYLTPANAYQGATHQFSTFFGWRHFLKWGNYASTAANRRILGADAITDSADDYLDVATANWAKSYHRSSVGALTMENLARYLEGFWVGAQPHGHMIDTLVGCRGLWTNMVEQDVVRYQIEIGGRPGGIGGRGQNANDGTALIFDGRSYSRHTSDFLEDGLLLGVRGGNNWNFVTPPGVGDASGQLGLPEPTGFSLRNPIEWLTQGAMSSMPIMRNAATTSTTAHPLPTTGRMKWYILQGQMMPEQIPGLVLEGVSTSKTLSSAS